MRITKDNWDINFSTIRESSTWNSETTKELKMHKIHVYPAKFPSFLIEKSLSYAKRRRVAINSIGDIFCGCGTTALEAKKNNKEFWGCDINPVATLIAKVKRETYDLEKLELYFSKIISYQNEDIKLPSYIADNERITYWFIPEQIIDLYKLLNAIENSTPKGKYRDFFLVAFSNILKRCSRWLTKSIKPQVDPNKMLYSVGSSFVQQYKMMFKAAQEANLKISNFPKATILNKNFLTIRSNQTFLDMLITSPPYVTSYEYADLHQLSTMWLGYAKDFRELRNGTIGSLYHQPLKDIEVKSLDMFAQNLFHDLTQAKAANPKAALKYFVDMKNTIDKSYSIINPGGLAVFVIGNTTHKQIYIDNAKYLTKCMLNIGFEDIEVVKRKISSKILSPYRDKNGKFSNDKSDRKIYSYEFVILAKKPIDG